MKIICSTPISNPSYEIEIEIGLLDDLRKLTETLNHYASRFVIITDETIAHLYGKRLHQDLLNAGFDTLLLTFPPGEIHKTRKTKEQLEDRMLAQNLNKDTCVIAMGGGVVTDLAGYLAATYCRGIPLILIPTSLLGMVDACIGGKTAVNVAEAKNMIGTFYQPKKIWIDPVFLKTLPLHELKNGLVEIIKHGLITDRALFNDLEKNVLSLLNYNLHALQEVIIKSCLIKQRIIEQDVLDIGQRSLLNFGHTIGHALEKLSRYTVAHGEAVAIGILIESKIAMHLGHLDKMAYQAIQSIFIKYALSLKFPKKLTTGRILKTLLLDKKSIRGKPRFVLLNDLGSCYMKGQDYCWIVDETIICKALTEFNQEADSY